MGNDMPFQIIDLDPAIDLVQLVSQLEFNPYRLLHGESPETRNAAWANGLQSLNNNKDGLIFQVMENNKIAGICAFTPLPWDSRLFQKKMGMIQFLSITNSAKDPYLVLEKMLAHIIHLAKSKQYAFLLHKCASDNFKVIHSLEDHGFKLESTILNFMFNFHTQDLNQLQISPLPSGFKIRKAEPSDEENLVIVSQKAYDNFFGRYHADERFTKLQATGVYEEWIHSSFHGYADLILVAENQGRIVGYSIWKKNSNEEKKLSNRLSHLSLGAVDPEYSSKGIYNSLLFEGLKALSPDSDLVLIPTQICNYPAQRAYIRLGWRPYDSFHDFHLWLSD
jgi:ribosomal protein S18 acetylase RimI-like enzyme